MTATILIAVPVAAAVATISLAALTLFLFFPHLVRRSLHGLLNRPISDTLAELYVSLLSTPPLDLLYLSLRAAKGDVIIRPMGSPKPRLGLDDLSLVPAQLARTPLPEDHPVELGVTLGPKAKRPLTLAIPMYVSGMAYGLALSKEARLALALGTREAKTALNSGQGPYLPEERALAYRYILQFGRWTWNREHEVLRAADMIEVQVGQGAMPGNAVLSHPSSLSPEIRERMHLRPGEAPIIHARLFLRSPKEPASLREVVAYLRSVSPEVPIAVKFGAGDDLEEDIDVALEAGVDVVVVDGTEGATGNAPITLSDHFGLPLMVAIARARRHLDRQGVGRDVSLVASGGLREPGDFLKAMALGADAVALGSAAMIAIAHAQVGDVLPYYPPTALVFYRDRPSHRLDPERGGRSLANYFESCRREMAIALRAMGLARIQDLNLEHLSTLDPNVAAMTGVHLSYGPREAALVPQGG